MKSMKKISVKLLVLVFTLVILSACSTTVTVSYLKPAKYDLSKYKNLAIASMQVEDVPPFSSGFVTVRYDEFDDTLFSGYNRRIASDVAESFTDDLYTDLFKTSYFDILKPNITDEFIDNLKFGVNSLEQLRALGVQALLLSEINSFDYQEYPVIGDYKIIENPAYATDPTQDQYIESDEREVTIVQQANITYSFRVVDINTGDVIASNSFSKNVENKVEYDEDLVSLPSMKPLYEKALAVGENQIVRDLSPQFISTRVALKKNNSGNVYFDRGFEAAKNSRLRVAYDNFDQAWNRSSLYEAGYNSAIVSEALGNRDEAIARMKEVYNYYGDVDSFEQINRMQDYNYSDNVAQDQINN